MASMGAQGVWSRNNPPDRDYRFNRSERHVPDDLTDHASSSRADASDPATLPSNWCGSTGRLLRRSGIRALFQDREIAFSRQS
jgi:hypothetical protein